MVIVGPTAVGKTPLAIQLAKHYNTEVISADSRQFYRELSIGTAKPSPKDLAQVNHHFINSRAITEEFNVGDFEQAALNTLNQLFSHNKHMVLAVGGSGLYIQAICEGFDTLPKGCAAIREQLHHQLRTQGIHALQQQLKLCDPEYYDQVDTSNPQRLMRALEVFKVSGKPFSTFRTSLKRKRSFKIIKIGLTLARKDLYQRINQRVLHMMHQGLLHEAQFLIEYKHLNTLNTFGYKELFSYLEHKVDLGTAMAMIQQNTRRFAKRQITWFNKYSDIQWFGPHQVQEIINYINLISIKCVSG